MCIRDSNRICGSRRIFRWKAISVTRCRGNFAGDPWPVSYTHLIDSPFITQLEQRYQNVQFQRIDADVTDNAKEEVAEDEKEAFQKTVDSLTATFRKELGNDKLDVKVEKLKDSNVASIMTLSEQSRRMPVSYTHLFYGSVILQINWSAYISAGETLVTSM